MSAKNSQSDNQGANQVGRPAAVIRKIGGVEETTQERLVKKYLPAWVISGGIHVAVILVAFYFLPRDVATKEQEPDTKIDPVATKDEAPPPKIENPVNEDEGIDASVDASVPDAPLAEQTAENPLTEPDTVGNQFNTDSPNAVLPAGDVTGPADYGTQGLTGDFMSGPGGGGGSADEGRGFLGRQGGTKQQLLASGGGTKGSEHAVATGLAWLARQQKVVPNTNPPLGYWEFDGSMKEERIAATGLALLPFLAAGETHKNGTKYRTHVEAGLRFLINQMDGNGKFKSPAGHYMYAHGIAAIALCEAYGMTKDKRFLLGPAQASINFIQQAQGPDGSWGYGPNPAQGDTSIVGWQIQALKAAQLTKEIKVNDVVVKKAMAFLDKVGSGEGSKKSDYGYRDANGRPGTALSAVGLLCRYYMDGWSPENAAFAQGTLGLFGQGSGNKQSVTGTNRARAPKAASAPIAKTEEETGRPPDMYYYYYATQVVHFYEGDEWREWNEGTKVNLFGARVRTGGMRDLLVRLQVPAGPDKGSWKPDQGFIGGSCGKLGSTCLCLLTLEVYYRHLPLYKRKVTGALDDK